MKILNFILYWNESMGLYCLLIIPPWTREYGWLIWQKTKSGGKTVESGKLTISCVTFILDIIISSHKTSGFMKTFTSVFYINYELLSWSLWIFFVTGETVKYTFVWLMHENAWNKIMDSETKKDIRAEDDGRNRQSQGNHRIFSI